MNEPLNIARQTFREANKVVTDYQVRIGRIAPVPAKFTCSGAEWDTAEELIWQAAEKAHQSQSLNPLASYWHDDTVALLKLCEKYLVKVEKYCDAWLQKVTKDAAKSPV